MFPEQVHIKAQITHLINTFYNSDCSIRPHFFLTGPSGSGKSFLVDSVASNLEIPVIEVNAAQLTAEGVSGNSLSKALRPLKDHWQQPNIIFIDEFDKVVQRNGEDSEGYRSAVQDEFLRVLEADETSVFGEYGKYVPVKVSNSLFIFAGAFSNQIITTLEDLKKTGLRNEFVGRVPLVFSTAPVTIESLVKAVPSVKLLDDYLKLYPRHKAKAVKDISNMIRTDKNAAIIGVRSLHSAIHTYFMQDIK